VAAAIPAELAAEGDVYIDRERGIGIEPGEPLIGSGARKIGLKLHGGGIARIARNVLGDEEDKPSVHASRH
jgi:hypothetical protein